MKHPFAKLVKNIQKLIDNVKRGKPLDIAIVAVAALLVIMLIVILILVLTGKKASKPVVASSNPSSSASAVSSYVNSASINVDEYAGVILEKTDDAGDGYITDTLFIGDSNTKRLEVLGLIKQQNAIAVSGMGVQHVLSTPCVSLKGYNSYVSVAKAVGLLQPRRILFSYGTNNTNWDSATFMKSYKAAVEALHEAYPNADIIFVSVTPVAQKRDYPAITMQSIDGFNEAIVQYAKEAGHSFLNVAEIMKDATTGYARTDYFDKDGVHMNKTGASAYMNYIRTHALNTEDKRENVSKVPTIQETDDTLFGANKVPSSSSDDAAASSSSSSSSAGALSFTLTGGNTVIAGGNLQLNGTNYKPSSDAFKGSVVVWSSSNPAVATVDAGGKVRGLIAGTTTITCTMTIKDKAYSQAITLTVTGVASSSSSAPPPVSSSSAPPVSSSSTPVTPHTHDFKTISGEDAATCVVAGKRTMKCDCGETQDIVIPATGAHQWGATDAATGSHTCSSCGTVAQDPAWVAPTPPPVTPSSSIPVVQSSTPTP